MQPGRGVEGALYSNWKEVVSHGSSGNLGGRGGPGVSGVFAHWSEQSAWRLRRSGGCTRLLFLLKALIVLGQFPFKKRTRLLSRSCPMQSTEFSMSELSLINIRICMRVPVSVGCFYPACSGPDLLCMFKVFKEVKTRKMPDNEKQDCILCLYVSVSLAMLAAPPPAHSGNTDSRQTGSFLPTGLWSLPLGQKPVNPLGD